MSISSIKSYSPQPLKSNPIRIFLSGVLIISVMAFIVGLTEWLTVSLTIELSLTALCILFCYACIVHVYQEHADIFQQEAMFKDQVITMMTDFYGENAPLEKIHSFLEKILEIKSTPNVRIEMLQHLIQNPKVIEKMVAHLQQEEQESTILKDLGLRWDHQD